MNAYSARSRLLSNNDVNRSGRQRGYELSVYVGRSGSPLTLGTRLKINLMPTIVCPHLQVL